MVRPVLHHADPLIPVLAASICPANSIVIAVGELALDRISMPKSHLVEQCCSHCPEAVTGHFILRIAHATSAALIVFSEIGFFADERDGKTYGLQPLVSSIERRIAMAWLDSGT